jgi:hypothetical protein
MKSNAVSAGQEELIGTVDIGQLHEIRWPIMRLLAGRYVEEMEMGRYADVTGDAALGGRADGAA